MRFMRFFIDALRMKSTKEASEHSAGKVRRK